MRKYLSTFLVAGLVAVAFCFGLVATTWSLTRALEQAARLQQYHRGRDVASQLEAYLHLSQQIASTLATLGSTLHDQGQAETVIQEVLASTSADFVYGLGYAYKPYKFDPKVRYFFPYVHRSARGIVLTYEWAAPEYDYPSQAYFKLGLAAKKSPVFSEPYFDTDYVYMSTMRAVLDQNGEPIGITGADLVLPQLQRLVATANVSPDERIFVTTGAGRVFAYPDEDRLLAWARAKGRPAQHLIDLTEQDVRAFESERTMKMVEQTVPVEGAGWHVHIATAPAALFAESRRVKGTVAVIAVLGWVLCTAGAVADVRKREIIERKRVEAELRESLRARDEFASVVSHEFKTPLAALSLRLQHLQLYARQGKPVSESMFGLALDQTKRMNILITDLLDVARMQADKLPFELSPAELTQVVRGAVASVAPLGTHQKLLVDLPSDETVVLVDSKRMEQVIWNLVENAIKYSPEGGTIRVSVEHHVHDAVVCVRDEGIGIPRDQLPHVFERYFRGRNAPITAFGGFGLGLYISREIVRRHFGRIWVESTEGRGSAFFVELPLLEPSSGPGVVQPAVHRGPPDSTAAPLLDPSHRT